jgi:hypothetical protein
LSRFCLLYDIGGANLKRGTLDYAAAFSCAGGNQEFPSDDAALFDRSGPVLFAYILKHVRSREDAEDLTLEVFTAALEKR